MAKMLRKPRACVQRKCNLVTGFQRYEEVRSVFHELAHQVHDSNGRNPRSGVTSGTASFRRCVSRNAGSNSIERDRGFVILNFLTTDPAR
jgi:hypothetical protein